MSLVSDLTDLVSSAFEAEGLDRSFGEVVVSQRPDLGQFQCNGAMAAARNAGIPPRQVAERIVERIRSDSRLSRVSVAGPGFINLTVTDDYLAGWVARIARGDDGLRVERPRRVLVDYGGPNVAKDLHVGHLRPAIIGESIKRIIRRLGHDVVGDVHLGDWGTPMGQLIAELEDRFGDLPYFDPDYTGPYPDEPPVTLADLQELYPIAAKKAQTDPEFAERARRATFELQAGRPGYRALWKHLREVSVRAFKEVYDLLGVEFELWLGESSVHDRIAPMVERLLASGVARHSQGAVVVDVADEDEDLPPLILVKSDGSYTYGTTDLATIEERVVDLGREDLIYVVDARQSLHFRQVFRAARRSGIAPTDVTLEHAVNGTVNGLDNKPLKTREGGLPLLRDLLAEVIERAARRLDENDLAVGYPEEERAEIARLVGVAAVKFGDLQNHRASNYVFDVERFTSFDGKTGPYLLYGAVRMRSILRNATERGFEPGPLLPPASDEERRLMLTCVLLPEVLVRSAELRAPNHLAEYTFGLVSDFSRFYEKCHILSEPDPDRRGAWLGLVEFTHRLLVECLDLLGIRVPDRM
ncbi:MAG: arginine--tRNA ligase [Acidimicrobiia bacterium]|nr:MAG: arginine--tRNA ligase [Acidimicrobiia bacterium]